MAYYIKLYFGMLAAFFAIDMLWLGLIARGFYQKQIGFLLRPATNWTAAVIFYLLFIFGVLYFAVLPGLKEGPLGVVLLRAALFGLVTYATYDLTNLATLKDWPTLLTVVDIAWGMALSTMVGAAGYFLAGWLG